MPLKSLNSVKIRFIKLMSQREDLFCCENGEKGGLDLEKPNN